MTLIKEKSIWLHLLMPVVPYILSPRKCSCTPALAGPGEYIVLTSYNTQQIWVGIIKINPGDKAVKVSLNGLSVDIKSRYEHSRCKNIIFLARKGALGKRIKVLEGKCSVFCKYRHKSKTNWKRSASNQPSYQKSGMSQTFRFSDMRAGC